MESNANNDLFITPMTKPAFKIDDENTVYVSSLKEGDRFLAMFTGEHTVRRSVSGIIECTDSLGNIVAFGPCAPVKPLPKETLQ